MATMNVSLPDAMKAWVEEQARGARYANASDYVRDLIRRDQERAARLASLQRLLDEGWASGEGEMSPAELLAASRAAAAARGL